MENITWKLQALDEAILFSKAPVLTPLCLIKGK
jgi:hypothetical protein